MKINVELYLYTIAIIMGLCGYYFGQNQMYKQLYDDKIECRLTADEFFEGNVLGEKK